MDFTKFDQQINKEEMAKNIKLAQENGGDYAEVPKGTYECKIEKLEIGATKNGEPMFKAQLRITEGDHKKQCLFFNRKIFGNKANEKGTWNDGVAINSVIGWLNNLGCDYEITFESYSQFNDLVMDIAEEVVSDNIRVEVAYDPEAFNNISIKDCWEI